VSVRRISLLGQLLLIAAAPLSLAAQEASRPAVGARVRVMTPALTEHPQVIGRITDVDSTSVTIHTDLGEDTRLPRKFISQVAVSEGTTRGKASVVHAAFAGLAIGALAGRLAIPERPENARQTGFRYAVKGGVIGSIAGAMFGAINRPERWEAVVLRGGTLTSPAP
jgi:hypothetical protein